MGGAPFRRSRSFDWGEAAVRFRWNTIDFLVDRWFWLTSTTIISHLSLYLVLLLALRFVGVSDAEVNWAQVLGVFAFAGCSPRCRSRRADWGSSRSRISAG